MVTGAVWFCRVLWKVIEVGEDGNSMDGGATFSALRTVTDPCTRASRSTRVGPGPSFSIPYQVFTDFQASLVPPNFDASITKPPPPQEPQSCRDHPKMPYRCATAHPPAVAATLPS